MLPGIAVLRPSLVSRFAWARDRVALPDLLSRVSIMRFDVSASAKFASGHSSNYLPPYDQGSHAFCVSEPVVVGGLLPHQLACTGLVAGDRASHVAPDDLILVNRRSTICIGQAELHRIRRQLRIEFPEQVSRVCPQGENTPLRAGHIHDATMNQWRGLLRSARSHGEGPLRRKAAHVVTVDLVQRAETLACIVLCIHQ